MNVQENQLARLSGLIARGQEVLATYYETRGVVGAPNLDTQLAAGWRTQALNALDQLIGQNNSYYEGFQNNTEHYSRRGPVRAGLGILESLKTDVEAGYMQTYRQLVAADLFSDFFDQAEHLRENGYLQPAASLAGAALENGLREIARDRGVTLASREDLSTLGGKLADRKAISRLEQKQLNAMADVRNAADHGEFDRFTADDVTKLIRDARDFLAKHAT